MKRDMELIRKMLLAMEGEPSGFAPISFALDGYTGEQIGYHALLLVEAGLADGNEVTHTESSSPTAILTRLTWAGHEFADAARDDTRWNKAMGIIKEKAGSISLAVLTSLLTMMMQKAVGLP